MKDILSSIALIDHLLKEGASIEDVCVFLDNKE